MAKIIPAIRVYLREHRWAVGFILPILFLMLTVYAVDYFYPELQLVSQIADLIILIQTRFSGLASSRYLVPLALMVGFITWIWYLSLSNNKISKETEGRETAIRKCLVKFDPTVAPVSKSEAKTFLSKPSERADLDVTRMVMSEFVCEIDVISELISRLETTDTRIAVLTGRRGVGLTTGLRYAAWKLRRNGKNDVYFVDPAKFGNEDFLAAIKAALVQGSAAVYILCDDFALDSDVKDTGLRSLKDLGDEKKSKRLRVLLSSRSPLSGHGVRSTQFTLSIGDRKRILERLNTIFDGQVTWHQFNADLAVGIGQSLTLDSIISSYRMRQLR